MLKLPKGLKKKKKGKKSKRKGEEELFTEEELQKYRREHQQAHSESGEAPSKENEEWSKFKDLTTGIDSVLKKTQGDLDRIKSTSFFQRIPTGAKQPAEAVKEVPHRPVVQVTVADFPQLVQAAAAAAAEADDADKGDCGLTDDESELDEQDDIFDTSYVDAVERGEVKLAYVPDSPEELQDDHIFDTSHVDALIKGQDAKSSTGKKGVDIGIAVEVLTGRIDNVTVTSKRPKRVIPGDLLLENSETDSSPAPSSSVVEFETSILDTDADVPITTPIDLSISLHTSLVHQNKTIPPAEPEEHTGEKPPKEEDDFDEFTQLATESLENTEVTKLESTEIELKPVIQESWSAFEANKSDVVFAESIVEDQIDILDPYLDQDDPFDTSFADTIVPTAPLQEVNKQVALEEDDDFDPRAEEVQFRLNNRRKSSVRIHITDPSGLRESVTSDDVIDRETLEVSRDLLGASTTDLTQLGDSPLDPADFTNPDIDPFDTTLVDKAVAPGKVELKLLEQELIGATSPQIYRVPSDPDFDPRADENKKERRASRPENLTVSKSVIFNVEGESTPGEDLKPKSIKPLTPYYTRELSITEDINEEAEATDVVRESLTRTRSDEDIVQKVVHPAKRRHSEFSQGNITKIGAKANDLIHGHQRDIPVKVLTPVVPEAIEAESVADPFDTSFASNIAPSKTELKLLAKEFSCEETSASHAQGDCDLLEPSDDIFQIKALTPEPSDSSKLVDDFDPFDTSFAGGMENSLDRPVKPTDLDLVSMTTEDGVPSEEEIQLEAAPGPHPLPPETQNLILSVTGQMEFTSSHLLDRIPPTRTPSPVSARDIHSPSPTPELEAEAAPAPDTFDINRNKPARPPPARPPPVARPPPPRPAPPPVSAQPQQPPQSTAADDINLFDAPIPGAVKPTKEAIMSLYSAPKQEEKQIDFLSDDILEQVPDPPSGGYERGSPLADTGDSEEPAKEGDTDAIAVEMMFPETESLDANTAAPMDCTEPTNDITPNGSDMDAERVAAPDAEGNPFEGVHDDEATAAEVAGDLFGLASSVPGARTGDGTFEVSHEERFATDRSPMAPASPLDAIEGVPARDGFESGPEGLFGEQRAQAERAVDPGWGDADVTMHDAFPEAQDAFDMFSAKFESTTADHRPAGAAWGEEGAGAGAGASGFEAEAFDAFLSLGAPPPPAATPRLAHQASGDSADDNFSVFIRPKESERGDEGAAVPVPVPALAPPPRPAALPDAPRPNPFDQGSFDLPQDARQEEQRRGSGGSGGETPPTPLFDEDVSVPLEDFPRTKYDGPGWEMHLRQPNKKKITGQRFWKKIFVRLVCQGDNPAVQLFNQAGEKEPFQELPLQACYSVSEVGAQQFDQFGKIFTVKLQYVFYKERPGVRPGQVTKAERITNKLSQFAAYAIQGDYQGVKEFGSDLRKLGLPVEHAPQVSQLFKIGSLNYEDVKQFSCCVEEALFRIPAHRDRALTYKMEEVQITAVDELYVEQDAEGCVLKQIARVRVFFLGFLSGMPDVELGVNDLRRQGKEVVGRHDIIPVVTEEWIRVEAPEFHACVQPEDFHDSQIIKFKPPDACYIELMRFRVRPPKNRELPLQLRAVWCVTGNKVELRADVLVPGFASRKLGQVPCEDVAIRFPIPECWIYLFRIEKHFRYGSVKSAHRRTGKIKGIERFLGAVDTLQESLIEVTSGQAKYEHQHRAIVWRMPRLPKEGQGAYTTHNLVCRMALTSYDQVPAELARHALVEFTMPATQVSHVTVRSVSLQQHDTDPPEKYVRYLARHEYIVGIERTSGQSAPAYALAAAPPPATPSPHPAPAPAPALPQPPSSDSESE